jgi:tryptophanyl-tRNA synthetase
MAKRVFSGIQPTGTLHIGNYLGAIRNWVDLQQDHDCIYCVVDYHAMTIDVSPAELRAASRSMALDLLACGVDPERSILFGQADVPQHTELGWILGCVTSYGDLARMTQFKDKSEQQEFVTAGLFTYPVLQAADILMYKAQGVPVGEDQVQHLELSRRIARRFNSRFGETFPEPEPIVTKGARIMSLADPMSKMSKSAAPTHYVGVMEAESSIRKKVRSAVTDVGLTPGEAMSPGVANLFQILEIACDLLGDRKTTSDLKAECADGKLLYSRLKDVVFDRLMGVLRPIQERRARFAASGDIDEILAQGAEHASETAVETMREVRQKVGLGAAT